MNSNPNTPVAGLVERLREISVYLRHKLLVPASEDVAAAASHIEQLEADNRRLYERLVETQMNAHKWMEAHDKLHSGKPYEFPKPADLPETVAQLEADKRALVEALIDAFDFLGGVDGAVEIRRRILDVLPISNPSPVKGTE